MTTLEGKDTLGQRIERLKQSLKSTLFELQGYNVWMYAIGVLIPVLTFLVLWFAKPKFVLEKDKDGKEVLNKRKVFLSFLLVASMTWAGLLLYKYYY